MTQDDLLYRFRLRVFAMAAELGNVRAACRAMGIHPSTYYRWKRQLDRHGPEILRPRERRQPLDLYHTALVVHLPEGRFVVENCWPIPDPDGRSRGVVVQGPVPSRRLAGFACSAMRCAAGATGSSPTPARPWPARTGEQRPRHRVGCWTCRLPAQPGLGSGRAWDGEMWNSNSVMPGCWPAAACRPTRSVLRLGDGPRDGGRAWSRPRRSIPGAGANRQAEARCTLVSLIDTARRLALCSRADVRVAASCRLPAFRQQRCLATS